MLNQLHLLQFSLKSEFGSDRKWGAIFFLPLGKYCTEREESEEKRINWPFRPLFLSLLAGREERSLQQCHTGTCDRSDGAERGSINLNGGQDLAQQVREDVRGDVGLLQELLLVTGM